MSNGTSIASKSSPHESETDTCQPPRSSLTCVSSFSPVQPSSIEELRMWLAQAFPVSHSQLQESKQEPMTSETCGPQPGTLFATFDQPTFCWKTCQNSLIPTTSESSLPTWPGWGIALNGECLALTVRTFRTTAPDYGWLPTPRASMATHGICWARAYANHKGNLEDFLAQKYVQTGGERIRGLSVSPYFVTLLMGWPQSWVSLQPLETDKYQQWLDAHGSA